MFMDTLEFNFNCLAFSRGIIKNSLCLVLFFKEERCTSTYTIIMQLPVIMNGHLTSQHCTQISYTRTQQLFHGINCSKFYHLINAQI